MTILNITSSGKCGFYLFRLLIVMAGFFLLHSNLKAEENDKAIRYEITPYLWAASINGTTAAGGTESPPIDSGYSFFSLDNLDGVASATFTARGEQWGFLFDFLYVAYEDTLLEGTVLEAKPRLEGRVVEFTGSYKPASVNDLQVIGGLRYQDIDVEVSILNNSPQASADWVDPFIGVIYSPRLSNKLYLSLRGDLGGFGIQSDLAINAEAMLRYQFGDTFSAKLGYRYLKVDFEDGNLIYDLTLDGVLFGLGIQF